MSDTPAYLSEYTAVREVPGRGWCGIMPFLFTVGICYGLDETGYMGRYCYGKAIDAIMALKVWTGEGHPPGPWIKHKARTFDGMVDEWNPEREKP